MIATVSSRNALGSTRELLELDRSGRPKCRDARVVLGAVRRIQETGDEGAVQELLAEGFLRESDGRYAEHVAPLMRRVAGSRFELGTDESELAHFCGEAPRHPVELSSFEIASVTVTNELYALLAADRVDVPAAGRHKPVVGVTWFDAALFALWVGCRLPTEAEWEFACGAGSRAQWCCEREDDLPRYAWFSENSGGRPHRTGTREPNAFGLFDLHGNVWEWCEDVYDQDFYVSSPAVDPIARDGLGVDSTTSNRVCRGGSMHALAEMCRTRYRFHEPAEFWAYDLGFRLARSTSLNAGGE